MLAGTGREHLARNLPPMDFAVSATLRSGLLFSVVHSTLSAADSDQLWPFSYRITSLALLLPRLYPGGSAVLVSWGGRHGMGGGVSTSRRKPFRWMLREYEKKKRIT